MTGMSVDQSELRKVREAIPDTPLLANTGVTIDSVNDLFAMTDGCVIGSHLKHNGDTWDSVDPDRVRKFMDKVESIR
jgi:predicted TIM-barrel enzyme